MCYRIKLWNSKIVFRPEINTFEYVLCHYGCLGDHEGKGANRLGATSRQRGGSSRLSSAVLVGIDV